MTKGIFIDFGGIVKSHRLKKLRILTNCKSKTLVVKTIQIEQFDKRDQLIIKEQRKKEKPFKFQTHDRDLFSDQFIKNSGRGIQDLIPADQQLDVIASANEYFEGSNASKHMITMTFDEYLKYDGPMNLYLAQIPLYKKISEQDIELIGIPVNPKKIIGTLNDVLLSNSRVCQPQFVDQEIDSINLWASRGKADSGWHYDSYNNYLVVMNGMKVIWLSKPTQRVGWDKWQSIHREDYNHVQEGNQQWMPKNSRYVIVKKCQAIFIPRGWLHRVISVEDSVAINIWFGGSKANGRSPLTFHLRQLLNKTMNQEASKQLKRIGLHQLRKMRNIEEYAHIISTKQFELLRAVHRYRTKNNYSLNQEIAAVTIILYDYSSIHTIEFLSFLIARFGQFADRLLRKLSPVCLAIIAEKLTDFTEKEQFMPPEDHMNLWESFERQKQEKLVIRDKVFSSLQENFSKEFLDQLLENSQNFKKQLLIKLVQQHIN